MNKKLKSITALLLACVLLLALCACGKGKDDSAVTPDSEPSETPAPAEEPAQEDDDAQPEEPETPEETPASDSGTAVAWEDVCDKTDPSLLVLDEYPGVTFRLDQDLTADDTVRDGTVTIFSGATENAIENVYLADLNGDGCREFFGTVRASKMFTGSTLEEEDANIPYIIICDYVNLARYTLLDSGSYVYTLTLKDGSLFVTAGDISSQKDEGALVYRDGAYLMEGYEDRHPVAEISMIYFDSVSDLEYEGVYIWGDYYLDTDLAMPAAPYELTLEEYPDTVFKWGTQDDTCCVKAVSDAGEQILYTGLPIWNVYIADVNGDGFRDFCSVSWNGSAADGQTVHVCDYHNAVSYSKLISQTATVFYILEEEDGKVHLCGYWYTCSSMIPVGSGELSTDLMEGTPIGPAVPVTPDDQPADVDWEALYAPVLEMHEQALVEQWDIGTLMDNDISSDYAYFYSGGREAREVIGYTYLDLDGNGIPELLLGHVENNNIYDAYTILNGKAEHILKGWDRSSFTMLPGNLLLNIGSSGAFSTAAFLREFDGKSLVFVRGMVYDYNADKENPYFEVTDDSLDLTNAEHVTEEEFNEFAYGQESVSLNYTPFLTYG